MAVELLLPLQVFESDSKSEVVYGLTETANNDLRFANATHNSSRFECEASRGFTLLELMLVVAVGMILAAMAVPVIGNTMRIYSMRSAISSSDRSDFLQLAYQAIFHGCKSQVVIDKSYLQLSGTKRSPGVRRTSLRRCLHERGRSGPA